MQKMIFLADLDEVLLSEDLNAPLKSGQWGGASRVLEATLAMMRRTGEIVVITEQGSEAFARSAIRSEVRGAILSNGAVILDAEGKPDREWLAHTSGIGRSAEPEMMEMMATIAEEYGDAMRVSIAREHGAPVYLRVEIDMQDVDQAPESLAEVGVLLAERFDLADYQQEVRGGRLSLTPRGISKRAACERLIHGIEDRPDVVLVGVGEHLSDLLVMGLCDQIMTSSFSQIARRILPKPIDDLSDP